MKKIYNKTFVVIVALLIAGVTSSSSLKAQVLTAGNNWVPATMLFDGVTASGYEFGGGIPVWCNVDYEGSPATWNTYVITSASNIEHSPTGWTIEGSNNNSTWTTLDTKTGIVWSSNTEAKTIQFENSTSYRYYKFTVTSSIVGWGTFVGELTFSYDTAVQISEHKLSSLVVKTTASKSNLIVDFGRQISREKVTIFDMKGSKVSETMVDGNHLMLNISHLKHGVYVVKTSAGIARFIK